MEKGKILVVDDESRMRKLVKDFLQREGFEVLEAGDGSEALDIFFSDKDIVLIILDVMMPKMDGWQVCREIRSYSKVPIIMLTARADEKDELQGFELEWTSIFPNPSALKSWWPEWKLFCAERERAEMEAKSWMWAASSGQSGPSGGDRRQNRGSELQRIRTAGIFHGK